MFTLKSTQTVLHHSGILHIILLALVLFAVAPLQAETVNINKADAATLQHYLVGIGSVKAEAIVEYRHRHGRFKSVDDLAKVRGIGTATIERNRGNLSVSKGVSRIKANSVTKSRDSADKG